MDIHRSPVRSRLLSLGLILLVLGIYSYPAIKTSAATGSRVLPPASAPDLSLYMNISQIRNISSTEVLDPYYGVAAPVARLGYLKFRLPFQLFGGLSTALHGNLWWTLLLWNLFWWCLLCLVAIWFFRQLLPDGSTELVLGGLAVLMFFNFGVLQSQLAAWIHLPSFEAFRHLELPYIRPFFPQIPIPLLILYLGLQIKALQKGTWRLWAAMGTIQLLAFMIFPYAVLMMAGITAVAVLGQFVSAGRPLQWRTLSIYTLACAAGDLLFLFHGGGVARTGAPGQYSLIHIQLSVLPHRIGGMWLVLAVLTTLVWFVRDSAAEVRWPLIGLGLSNLFLLAGDAFFSETALQVSVHAGYFVQLTAAVLFIFLLSAALRYLQNRRLTWQVAMCIVATLLVVNGMLIAYGTYQAFLPPNHERAELTRFSQFDPLQADDLVIARSLDVDDDCAWVPLISSSHVLYCRSAQVLLSPEQNQQIQRFRQALYLYFTNRDGRWVEQILESPNAINELMRLMFLGQVTSDRAERQKGVDALRAELLPMLTRVEQRDSSVRSFFSRYKRVVVVDNVNHPYFSRSRLADYLKIEKEQSFGSLVIFFCMSREE